VATSNLAATFVQEVPEDSAGLVNLCLVIVTSINSLQRVTPEHNFRLGMRNSKGVSLVARKNVLGVINT